MGTGSFENWIFELDPILLVKVWNRVLLPDSVSINISYVFWCSG